MICALMLDLEDSPDFPGNEGTALGRPLCAYPLMAAKSSALVQKRFVMTASQPIKSVALQYDAVIIDPPKPDPAPQRQESLLKRGYELIREDLKRDSQQLELLVVLLAQAPAVTAELIDAGIEELHNRPELDFAVSVSAHKRLNPYQAKRVTEDDLVDIYIQAAAPSQLPDAWYPNGGVKVLRAALLPEALAQSPINCLGKKIFALKQWGPEIIDYQWQIPSLEYWLQKNGVSDAGAQRNRQPQPQMQKAQQPAPRTSRE